jgi:dCMP deaminase
MTDTEPLRRGRDRLDWNDYFMAMAQMASIRSPDPDTQIGCVIVDWDKTIISTGYNGPPPNIDDNALDWSRPEKYNHVIHAEANAILRCCKARLNGCRLYVTGFPCLGCLKMMAAKGLPDVFYGGTPVNMCDREEREKVLALAKKCDIMMEYLECPTILLNYSPEARAAR